MKFLTRDMIETNFNASNAEEAIIRAGKLLLNEGGIDKIYIDAMLDSYKNNGPYFVLSPKIAMPHARPEDGVNEASVSLVKLDKPVKFGHMTNDPVSLVFGLGATSGDEHLELLQKLTVLLNTTEKTDALLSADNVDEIIQIIEKRNVL